ncbi:MAG: AAA family ATPase, partial [Lachnospiraceae bacterium]|nr:AAA family ATPase [Lachnospiraceae bacterium]
MENYLDSINRMIEAVRHVVSGKDDVVRMAVAALIAGGHILIEDIPGVGKTTLAVALSKVMQLDYRRMQFTPDVMPTDVVGYRLYSKTGEDMGLKSGSIMCNLFLADEINRTSPKTQSALLEVMEEGNVTVDGVTVSVPRPFHVIATQNPIGSAGTQALPESQLDRFMIRLSLGYPDLDDEIEIMRTRHEKDPMDDLKPVMAK